MKVYSRKTKTEELNSPELASKDQTRTPRRREDKRKTIIESLMKNSRKDGKEQ